MTQSVCAQALAERLRLPLWTIAVHILLLCLSTGCAAIQRFSTPCPTCSIAPTYTPFPTLTPISTSTPATLAVREGWQYARVLSVTDGDTIQVTMDDKTYSVRYIGINAPEVDDPCYTESSRFNSYLVFSQNKAVYLEKDTSDTDTYDRLLRYVWLITPGKYVLVNAELVAMGYAVAKAYPPDIKYQSYLQQVEQQARQTGLTSCRPTSTPTHTATPTPTIAAPTSTAQSPTATNAPPSGCPQGCIAPSAGCSIKGNISSSGEKIYHLPGQRYYEQTVIDPNKGERWFCTEQEATANGWRKSKQ
jgi:endonuclease YncB( thermonuclease family)